MSSTIETSSIWKDVSKVIASKPNDVFYDYRATIHTALEDYGILSITNIDIVRDYMHNVGDHIQIVLLMSFGDYVKRLYPFVNNLELTITTMVKKVGNGKPPPNIKQRYKAVFLPHNNIHIDGSEYSAVSKETLDHMQPVTVTLQLLDRALEPLRIKMTAGTYINIKQESLMRSVITTECNKILVDGKPCLDAIDIYTPDNSDIQTHIILPTGTHVLSIPTYLQEKMNGVYGSGIGSYFQTYAGKRTFFIYPLYNTKRYNSPNTNKNKAIFYFVPSYTYKGIDNTYMVDGSVLKVLCTSDKKYLDDGETQYMNSGSGFMQADARAFMSKPVVLDSNNVPSGNPARTMTQVVNKSRDDGLNYAPVSKHGISSNPFIQYSEIAKRNVSKIDIVWEHSDASLIYPGMPCEFVFLDNGVRTTLKGIIVNTHTSIFKANTGVVSSLMARNTLISILAERRTKITTASTTTPVTMA